MRVVIPVCLALFSLVGGGCSREKVVERIVERSGVQQDVAMVSASNAKMNAAMDEARRTVGQFTQAMQSAKPEQRFTVKVRVTDGAATEYMWLSNVTFDGTAFHGTLSDDPYQVKGYKVGQEIMVKPTEIADWIVMDGDKQKGGYTEKAIESDAPAK